MNSIWRNTRNFPFFFILYILLGGYFIFYAPNYRSSVVSETVDFQRLYLACIWLTTSVSFHFIASSIFAFSKNNVVIVYNYFIPTIIFTLMLLIIPLEGDKILQLCIVLLSFFYLGLVYRERHITSSEMIIQQFAWMSLFDGATFILFPRSILFLVVLLILGWNIFKQNKWFHLIFIITFYFIPTFLYSFYIWMTDDYFSVVESFLSLINTSHIKIDKIIQQIFELKWFEAIYLIVIFFGMLIFYLYKAIYSKGLLLTHMTIVYLSCELLFLSSSLSYAWWNAASLLVLLVTFFAIQTTYYRLLTLLIIVGFLMIIYS